ncbi:hypothetical protein TNCV_1823791 [Trichonephila clavipes]|nr:hypothetical protein TNCV_1823791 [Trichonephila clavipes]
MASSERKQKVQESKRNREFQTLWTEKYGMISKGDKAVCVLSSGIVNSTHLNKARLQAFLTVPRSHRYKSPIGASMPLNILKGASYNSMNQHLFVQQFASRPEVS